MDLKGSRKPGKGQYLVLGICALVVALTLVPSARAAYIDQFNSSSSDWWLNYIDNTGTTWAAVPTWNATGGNPGGRISGSVDNSAKRLFSIFIAQLSNPGFWGDLNGLALTIDFQISGSVTGAKDVLAWFIIQGGSNWYYSKMTWNPNADKAWTTHTVALTKENFFGSSPENFADTLKNYELIGIFFGTQQPTDYSQLGLSSVAGATLSIDNFGVVFRAPTPTLMGVSWYSLPSSPLVAINPANGVGTVVGLTGFNYLNSLARDKAGNLYSVCGDQLICINPVTGAGTAAATLNFGATPVDVRGLAFSPDGVLFAVNNTSNTDLLYTVNIANGVGTLVGDTGLSGVQSITFDSRGALYGWDTNVGLVTINPGTGAATDINPAQGGTTHIQGIAFGPDRILYGAGNALYKINTATGAWTLVGGGGYTDVRGLEAPLVTPRTKTPLPAITLYLLSD